MPEQPLILVDEDCTVPSEHKWRRIHMDWKGLKVRTLKEDSSTKAGNTHKCVKFSQDLTYTTTT